MGKSRDRLFKKEVASLYAIRECGLASNESQEKRHSNHILSVAAQLELSPDTTYTRFRQG